ncbi:protein of unknown function [Chitinophaga costaii]|uniref:DUF4954 domain-containing protein n=1 Tax=Chitinophaga costaii TaxID=1335309 RepID=A0A1C3Z7L5_9BACT|nr:DUF4954 family protein [Chitinophaga costaii]PUZ30262.1 DUF4954 domain-containing protein [Chitinophaga costaii]SCB78306.1 protein of unknown function [Chitinophaga costaii]
MNRIEKRPLTHLGYNFVDAAYLPQGKDEYYLRDQQWGRQGGYRQLNAQELEILVRNDNTSDNWNNIMVSEEFNPQLVQHCHFFGMVRIGKLEPYYLEYRNLRLAVGLYNSTITSCDFGDNVVLHNVNFLSHYIIGNEVILFNINEMETTDYAKFGNGIIKEGESEERRLWMELCNENGGRKILPFDGMLPGDAYLWTRHRNDKQLMEQFRLLTEKQFDQRRGYYGMVGDRTVIKNCKIIKDVTIGSDAYLKGANKLKNLTINSRPDETSQIGEGCELVNGIIGYGCRIFYGVKAVRFVMASHSQLKYGARLINSYLGNNATISCCEVLNSLIFPAHEQHHNNSFLCAALVMGQSNMAAGATIGSNHNSRGADGEIIAGRGFWPGLCVSLKHNSRFASFTLIAKGNYMHELDIPFPFSLVMNDEHDNTLKIMPGYWFLYNMYALARNAWKYVDRDKRSNKIQYIEYDYLAPDAMEEILHVLPLMEQAVGTAWYTQEKQALPNDALLLQKGQELLLHDAAAVAKLTVYAGKVENSQRKTVLLKVHRAYPLLREMLNLYGIRNILDYTGKNHGATFSQLHAIAQTAQRGSWQNIGGQLMPEASVEDLKDRIRTGKIESWLQLHDVYKQEGSRYEKEKLKHAIACMLQVQGVSADGFTPAFLQQCLQQSVHTMSTLTENIYLSRKKDYTNPFRKMVYNSPEEMEEVIGKLEDNSFIQQTKADLETYKKTVADLLKNWNL